MCLIRFFFLCRPGEHVETTGDAKSTSFCLKDVQFLVGQCWWPAHQIPLASMDATRHATLCYKSQKNGVQGQGITMGCTGHPSICPIKALLRRVKHLRSYNAPPTTPIYLYFDLSVSSERRDIFSIHLTCALRVAAANLFSLLGIEPKDISARSLRPGRATAMLCAHIDRNITQLIGCWKSDEMLKYLHVQAAALMANYSRQMFENVISPTTMSKMSPIPTTFLQPQPAHQKTPTHHPVP